jgi:hypothetical protein
VKRSELLEAKVQYLRGELPYDALKDIERRYDAERSRTTASGTAGDVAPSALTPNGPAQAQRRETP